MKNLIGINNVFWTNGGFRYSTAGLIRTADGIKRVSAAYIVGQTGEVQIAMSFYTKGFALGIGTAKSGALLYGNEAGYSLQNKSGTLTAVYSETPYPQCNSNLLIKLTGMFLPQLYFGIYHITNGYTPTVSAVGYLDGEAVVQSGSAAVLTRADRNAPLITAEYTMVCCVDYRRQQPISMLI